MATATTKPKRKTATTKRPAPKAKASAASVKAQPPRSKKAMLIELLSRPQGADIFEMTEATGWLPHTTRAALTRLRQAGYRVIRQDSDDKGSVYKISADAPGTDAEFRS